MVVEAISKLVLEAKAVMDSPTGSLEPVVKAAELIESTMSMLGVEGLRVTQEPKEAWIEAVDIVASLRQQVRDLAKEKDATQRQKLVKEVLAKVESPSLAKKAGLKDLVSTLETFQKDLKSLADSNSTPDELRERCDQVRNVDLIRLGVRLEDRGTGGYIWMFDDRQSMEVEQKEAEEKAKAAAREKIFNKLKQKAKELEVAEKAAINPKDLFHTGSNKGLYAEFDDDGVPTKLSSGEEVKKQKRKDLAKELAKQQKDYQKLQSQGDVDAVISKMRSEVDELKRQLQ